MPEQPQHKTTGEAMGFWLRTVMDKLMGGNFRRGAAGNRMQMRRLARLRLFQPLLPAPQRWVRKHDRRRNA